jgi:hypothetical protein
MEIFQEWLRNNGYHFEVQPFGIDFKYQGGHFIIFDNSGDELYLHIVMPAVYKLNDSSEKLHVLEACNELTKSVKCLKAFFADEDTIWLSTEIFIDRTPELDDFMERLLDILHQGRMKLKELL